MRHSASLMVSASASSRRLRALVTELAALDCHTKLDHKAWRLEFDVPGDLYSWIRAGGLGALLRSYGDVVVGSPRFHEVAARRQELRQLPAPRQERMRA
jgi:hypothetical protein